MSTRVLLFYEVIFILNPYGKTTFTSQTVTVEVRTVHRPLHPELTGMVVIIIPTGDYFNRFREKYAVRIPVSLIPIIQQLVHIGQEFIGNFLILQRPPLPVELLVKLRENIGLLEDGKNTERDVQPSKHFR